MTQAPQLVLATVDIGGGKGDIQGTSVPKSNKNRPQTMNQGAII